MANASSCAFCNAAGRSGQRYNALTISRTARISSAPLIAEDISTDRPSGQREGLLPSMPALSSTPLLLSLHCGPSSSRIPFSGTLQSPASSVPDSAIGSSKYRPLSPTPRYRLRRRSPVAKHNHCPATSHALPWFTCMGQAPSPRHLFPVSTSKSGCFNSTSPLE